MSDGVVVGGLRVNGPLGSYRRIVVRISFEELCQMIDGWGANVKPDCREPIVVAIGEVEIEAEINFRTKCGERWDDPRHYVVIATKGRAISVANERLVATMRQSMIDESAVLTASQGIIRPWSKTVRLYGGQEVTWWIAPPIPGHSTYSRYSFHPTEAHAEEVWLQANQSLAGQS